MQELRALCRIHAVDEHGAAAGEREAETVHGLVGLGTVDIDDLAGGSGAGEGEFGGLLGEERGAVGIGEPECGGLLRMGRNAEQRKGGEDNRSNEFRAHRRSPDLGSGRHSRDTFVPVSSWPAIRTGFHIFSESHVPTGEMGFRCGTHYQT